MIDAPTRRRRARAVRRAERLIGQPITSYATVPKATLAEAVALLDELIALVGDDGPVARVRACREALAEIVGEYD